MKNIYSILVLMAGFLCFTACEDDRDSNPTLQEPTVFKLNTPAYADAPYDLEKSTVIELTCSQPDYGFTAAAVYTVQISLVNDFGTEGAFETLPSTYTTAKMNVDASEIAVVATGLATEPEANFPIQTKIYLRLKAALSNGMGEVYSNSIELSDVRLHFALPPVVVPTEMNIIGGFCDWNWNNSAPMVLTYDNNGTFWRLLYVPEGSGLKFNTVKDWDGGQFGATAEVNDNAGAGTGSDGDGNITVTNGGWYLIVLRATVVGRTINYVVEFNAPNVYLMGPANGGSWDAKPEQLFTVPTTADASFVSPAFVAVPAADTGVRACVFISGADWWKTEFMVFDGVLKYRATGGDQDRVVGAIGQKLYINFTKATGEIK